MADENKKWCVFGASPYWNGWGEIIKRDSCQKIVWIKNYRYPQSLPKVWDLSCIAIKYFTTEEEARNFYQDYRKRKSNFASEG